MRHSLLPFFLGIMTSPLAFAQSPSISHCVPAAALPDKTTTVTFFGNNLANATELWTSFAAKATRVSATNKNDEARDKAVFQLTIPKHTPVGIGAVRLATTNGISSLQLFMLDDLPGATENGSNKTLAAAQELKLPVAVDGACEELSFDYYKFRAKKGQRISIEVVANRLGSPFDPVVRLLDANGKELVYCDDDPALGPDARFAYTIPATGPYWIEVRDLAYQGSAKHRYRLRVGDFPLVNFPFPLAVNQSAKEKITFAGPAVSGVRPLTIAVPHEAPGKVIHLGSKPPGSKGSAFATLAISQLPELVEREPNDTPETAAKISLPTAINARFAKPKDRDFFEFQATNGQRFVFSGKTRSLGAPCDLFMRLFKADGALVSEANITGANEGTLTNTFKEAGTYRLLVEELNHQGGPEMAYRVEVEPLQPGFVLTVDTDKVEAQSGGTFSIKVTCVRREYDGPITLSLAGLGDAGTLENHVIPEKKNETTLKASVPARLQAGHLVNFSIVGKARIGDAEQTVTASTMPALRKLFPLMRYPPPEFDGLIGLGIRPAASKPPPEKKDKAE